MSIENTGNRRQTGNWGEQVAAEYVLKVLGWPVCCRNWRNRFGELDLIAWDGETLVIIEVRTRTSATRGNAIESIDTRKILQLRKLIPMFLADRQARNQISVARSNTLVPVNFDELPVRVDVITMDVSQSGVQFRHLRGAIDGMNATL